MRAAFAEGFYLKALVGPHGAAVKALAALATDDLRGLRSLARDPLRSGRHAPVARPSSRAPRYDALWDLSDAGLRLVAVTGRPSGWGEVIARQWPIDGAVTENGAVT